ncbi:hypothetical protein A9Q76_09925 [Arcobacter sp. 31_11_sub10_T18]|nr:hypothetical protein A9Q76_09925 [Arcobacter sp. 31_11_sub10_T18]
MKTLIKRLFYSSLIGITGAIIALNIFSNVILDDLKQYNQLHIDRNYLYDSAIICTQLYFMNPNGVNQLTCDKINAKISSINNELKNFYFTNLYLKAMK